jgi:hypothetical protein
MLAPADKARWEAERAEALEKEKQEQAAEAEAVAAKVGSKCNSSRKHWKRQRQRHMTPVALQQADIVVGASSVAFEPCAFACNFWYHHHNVPISTAAASAACSCVILLLCCACAAGAAGGLPICAVGASGVQEKGVDPALYSEIMLFCCACVQARLEAFQTALSELVVYKSRINVALLQVRGANVHEREQQYRCLAGHSYWCRCCATASSRRSDTVAC